jgi:hypothetical protein
MMTHGRSSLETASKGSRRQMLSPSADVPERAKSLPVFPKAKMSLAQIRALHQQQVFQVAQLCEQEMNLGVLLDSSTLPPEEARCLALFRVCAERCRHLRSTSGSSTCS